MPGCAYKVVVISALEQLAEEFVSARVEAVVDLGALVPSVL